MSDVDLDGFVRDFDHPTYDVDFNDFDGKVEAAYLQHTRGYPSSTQQCESRPRTASHRRPLSGDSNDECARAEYKPRVSLSILEEVRNTLNPTEGRGGRPDKAGFSGITRPLSAASSCSGVPTRTLSVAASGVPARTLSASSSSSGVPRTLAAASSGVRTMATIPQAKAELSMSAGAEVSAEVSTLAQGKLRRPKSSQVYLRERRIKQEEKEKKLEMDVGQCCRELEYSYLSKMGEMNKWCEALGDPAVFRPFRSDGGDLRCHIYESGSFVKEISSNMLEKRHKMIERQYHDAVLKGQIREERQAQPTHLTEDEQVKRQQEIREALLQTMHLTNKIKEQLAMLDQRSAMISPFVVE